MPMFSNISGGFVINSGVYAIQFCQFNFEQGPQSIKATGTLNDNGVDIEMSADLMYSDNRVGNIKTSVINELSNAAKIIRTNGAMMTVGKKCIYWHINF